ncbi:MAG: radical SAM protein [Candidatus Shapirobacteria bacterium]|jgi:organic radical activating enzyme
MIIPPSLVSALENIYISPFETCNLHCRLCYTKKSPAGLSNSQILNFVNSYSRYLENNFEDTFFDGLQRVSIDQPKKSVSRNITLKSIIFCGGEVFLRSSFPSLINRLNNQNIFITIITNGTIDKLTKIKQPSACQLLVSLDGPQEIHDQNRGSGNFDKTISFIRHALQLGFPTEIMFLVTPDSYPYSASFSNYLSVSFGLPLLRLNYITLKSGNFINGHPLCQTAHTGPSLTSHQIIDLKKNYSSLPPKDFGCFQLALQSNGLIYGCCESPYPLGSMNDNPQIYINNLFKALKPCLGCGQCRGCCAPDFLCGYLRELQAPDCQNAVKLFH